MKTDKINCVLGMVIVVVALSAGASSYVGPEYLAASPDGKAIYVTAASSGKVLVYDVASKKVSGEWQLMSMSSPLSGWRSLFAKKIAANQQAYSPNGVAVSADGTVYVTAGGASGELLKLSASGKILARVATGHTPMSPVVSQDGKTIYVLNRFNNMVSVIDATQMTVKGVVPVLREPHAAVLGAGGKLLFVANHLPFCQATNDTVAASISVIDTATLKVVKNLMLPNGSTGVRGVGVSPDGKTVYVTHTFGRYQLPTTQLERGWMNTAGLSVFNGETGEYVNTVLLDNVDLGAANPWGVTVSPDSKKVIVAHAGTREISVIDRVALHERLEKAAKGEKVTEVTKSATEVPNDLSFLVSIRNRISLGADGPRGVVMVGDKVFVSLYFADMLAEVAFTDGEARMNLVALGAPIDLSKDRVRRGEMLFNDGMMCFQQWQSCASCHPDGRADGLNWDLVNDGIGNPKQTKNMVYSHLTPPTMVTGIRSDMATCNRKGMTHIQFVIRPEEDALCIDQYVMSLTPVASPYLVNGMLSSTAKVGEKVFQKAGCVECHPSEKSGSNGERLFTNLKQYNLKLGAGNETDRSFDTTTLVENWRTAPYLYDGRALTIEEVLTTCNLNNTHGLTQALKPEERKALMEYILSY